MNVHLLLPMALLPAKLLEALARRVRLPGVVGAIGAGVLLGAGGLGLIPSEAADPDGYESVQVLAQIGLWRRSPLDRVVFVHRPGARRHLGGRPRALAAHLAA